MWIMVNLYLCNDLLDSKTWEIYILSNHNEKNLIRLILTFSGFNISCPPCDGTESKRGIIIGCILCCDVQELD